VQDVGLRRARQKAWYYKKKREREAQKKAAAALNANAVTQLPVGQVST
jgi:hypothetical protein